MPEGNRLQEVVARDLEDEIINGKLRAGDSIPSAHELSARYEISPSTASAATTKLARRGLVETRRGLGLFVTASARDAVLRERTYSFHAHYVEPMLAEAQRLGYSLRDVLGYLSAQDPVPGSASPDER